MALKGTLETFHLASILQLFSNEQKMKSWDRILKINAS